ncbi:MAG: hypothetical protein COB35_07720 [Gammaproteobacteria bacterium]|nr:MAG: hypothetical protein COB35_07720 [Gammaproteobacteria bacterium]
MSTSSFFLEKYLTAKLKTNTNSASQLRYALSLSIEQALKTKLNQLPKHSLKWLYFANKLAKYDGKTASLLAQFYLSKNTDKGVFWYQQAIRLDFEPAKLVLAKWYFSQHKFNKSRTLLNSIINKTPQSSLLMAKLLIAQGIVSLATKNLLRAEFSRLSISITGQQLLEKIRHYQILTNNVNQNVKTKLITTSSALACDNSIQFFATNLSDLAKIEQLIAAFKLHPLNDFVCFAPVRYRALSSLQCNTAAKVQSSFNKSVTIQCKESHWQDIANTIQSRFIGVLLPRGGANVHLGILYLDSKDNNDVFAHEISHLLGFVDEYPLPNTHQKCQATQQSIFATNVAVLPQVYIGNRKTLRAKVLANVAWREQIKASTPIFQQVNAVNLTKVNKLNKTEKVIKWQLGTPSNYAQEVGIFKAQSCDNTIVQAFKPVSYQTQLRYFEKDFPAVYSQILKQSGNKYIMPSFHYNIARGYLADSLHENNNQQAHYWLQQAAKFEHKKSRINKILTANF